MSKSVPDGLQRGQPGGQVQRGEPARSPGVAAAELENPLQPVVHRLPFHVQFPRGLRRVAAGVEPGASVAAAANSAARRAPARRPAAGGRNPAARPWSRCCAASRSTARLRRRAPHLSFRRGRPPPGVPVPGKVQGAPASVRDHGAFSIPAARGPRRSWFRARRASAAAPPPARPARRLPVAGEGRRGPEAPHCPHSWRSAGRPVPGSRPLLRAAAARRRPDRRRRPPVAEGGIPAAGASCWSRQGWRAGDDSAQQGGPGHLLQPGRHPLQQRERQNVDRAPARKRRQVHVATVRDSDGQPRRGHAADRNIDVDQRAVSVPALVPRLSFRPRSPPGLPAEPPPVQWSRPAAARVGRPAPRSCPASRRTPTRAPASRQ